MPDVHISNYIKKILQNNPLTDAIRLAVGTTAQRPAEPVDGDIRFNATTGRAEVYEGSWKNVTDSALIADATIVALAAYNTNGLLTQTAPDTFAGRTLTGTASEISMADGNGVAGNPTVGIADDAVLPGTGAVTLPIGDTAAQPGSPVNGMVRYNSQTDELEAYKAGAWKTITTSV